MNEGLLMGPFLPLVLQQPVVLLCDFYKHKPYLYTYFGNK